MFIDSFIHGVLTVLFFGLIYLIIKGIIHLIRNIFGK